MESSSWPTTVTAIIGAVTGTASLIWTIIRDRNDRGKLRVECSISRMFGGGTSDPSDPVFLYTITNIGRRPVQVTGIGGTRRKGLAGYSDFFIMARHLPRMLQPGERVMEWADDWRKVASEAETLTARDSLGRTYAASKKSVQALRVEAEKPDS